MENKDIHNKVDHLVTITQNKLYFNKDPISVIVVMEMFCIERTFKGIFW